MPKYREDELRRGLSLISQRGEVMPDQAEGDLRACYQDIQHVLRVPIVNFLFRVLANDPQFLIPAWRALRPRLTTRTFERAADELRAMAVLDVKTRDRPGVDGSLGDRERVHRFTETIHYVLPKLLLIATAWEASLSEHGAGKEGRETEPPDAERIPLGIAEGSIKVPMVNPTEATGRLAELLDDIRERHRHPGVASYYRALANWPRLLEALWQRVAPRVGSPAYERRKQILIERAEGLQHRVTGRRFPSPAAEREHERVEQLRDILAVFRKRLIPDLMLDVALIRMMLEGPEAAKRSALSAEAGTSSPESGGGG